MLRRRGVGSRTSLGRGVLAQPERVAQPAAAQELLPLGGLPRVPARPSPRMDVWAGVEIVRVVAAGGDFVGGRRRHGLAVRRCLGDQASHAGVR